LDSSARFTLVSKSTSEIVYRTVLPTKIEVTRRYLLAPDEGPGTDPYQLRVETSFRNVGSTTVVPGKVSFSLGTAAPVDLLDNGLYLASWYSDGKNPSSIPRAKFEASPGFFGTGMGAHGAAPAIDSPGPVTWAAVSNQFFVAILTPDQAGTGMTSRRVYLPSKVALPPTDNRAYGITGMAQFDVPALKPQEKTTLGANYYAGPKEYKRLSDADVFKDDQDKVMQFGFFKFFSALLLTLMTWIHSIVPNWGVSIVLTTLTLKTIFIYPTLASLRSSRRMQKLQPQMKIINEKYKDNPQKKNEATMALFKEHKVNPLGGCLPLLITMPFFFGFYSMLRSASELRFAHFLWAADLSAPDTVGHLFGISINILPILLGLVSFAQVKLSPQPTTDNAQAKMMMFTPLIMLFFCYSFSCALSLYSTTNGLFTIAQQLIINRMKDDGDPSAGALSAGKSGGQGGKLVKNVTPSKKK
jgi:YidC/Oxa1 family membrane protein insertase